jgi:ATP-dependent Clp protease ATP-binding subunit ClpC
VFERFTDYARRVVITGQTEAHELGHERMGTEHLVLGLTRERDSAAAAALESHGAWHDLVLERIVERNGRSEPARQAGNLPFSPEAKRVLELALRESLQLGQNYIGTEHILLGLLQQPDSNGMEILAALEVDVTAVKAELVQAISEASDGQMSAIGEPPTCPRCGRGLAATLGSRTLEAPDRDNGPTARVTIVYCRECGTGLGSGPTPS